MTRKQAWNQLVARVNGQKLAYCQNYDSKTETFCVVGHALALTGVPTKRINYVCYGPGSRSLVKTFGGDYMEWIALQRLSDNASNPTIKTRDKKRKKFNSALVTMQRKFGQ